MPFPRTRTCFRLRRAARQVSQIYDRELAAVDLSLNEYSILRRAEPEPRTLGELAATAGMDRSTLTRNLKPLIDAAWWKETRGEDARHGLVTITASGRKRIAKAMRHWPCAQQRLQALDGERATLRLNADLDALDQALKLHALNRAGADA
ncbi:MAG: MarR family winged helix-turn-helix transcriptional regulator [Pseudoxanthomonas sp.]